MSGDKVFGPRPPAGVDDEAGGGIQFAALVAERAIRLPKSWQGKYVRIQWHAATDGDVLEFLFADDADPVPTIDNTDSTGTEPVTSQEDNAPDWVEDKGQEHRTASVASSSALDGNVVLILKPAGAGRVSVRRA